MEPDRNSLIERALNVPYSLSAYLYKNLHELQTQALRRYVLDSAGQLR
uniref:Uncharacterized protein n=1 Tax=Siphoviridae sp. ctmpG14 TaxID=2825654 RepID=A0A8S5PC56_9CAUD|nr:MAG TPA: hypothetical protein [Siphoviridae sp. ctmpG14]